MENWIDDMVEKTLRVEIAAGNVMRVENRTTGWRTLPWMVIAGLRHGPASVSTKGGSAHSIASGEVALVPSLVSHRFDHPLCTVSCWVHVNFFVFGRLDLFRLIDVPLVLDRARGAPLTAAIQDWVNCRDQQQAQGALSAPVKRMELGLHILGILAGIATFRKDAHDRLERIQSLWPVIEHMNSHYAEPIYRDTLVQLAHMSASKFHRVFREATGETPMDYLLNIRLRHAQQSLIGTGQSVADIAQAVGYANPFIFSRRFKQSRGMSPLAYRNVTRRSMNAPDGSATF